MMRRSIAALVLTCAVAAQSSPFRFVDGRPVVRATLSSGETRYECHLLLDLARPDALFIHGNAARSLGSLDVHVEFGDIAFDAQASARRDTWLERFTAKNAQGLKEVPLAGRVGIGAFRKFVLEMDGPNGTVHLRPIDAIERPPQAADLTDDPSKRGIRFEVALGADRTSKFQLNPAEAPCTIVPTLAARLERPTGRLDQARVAGLELTEFVPLRPIDVGTNTEGTIGGAVMAQLVVTVHARDRWLALEAPAAPVFAADEAAFYAALYGSDPKQDLPAFIENHSDSPFRLEAARAQVQLVAEDPTAGAGAVTTAAVAAIESANADARAREAKTLLERLPDGAGWERARTQIAKKGLEFAGNDEDGTAGHALRMELGRRARLAGDLREARRQLLSVAFGMRGDGPANLELGRVYEAMEQPDRAMSRYLIALLDMKNTGVDGYLELSRLWKKRHDSDGLDGWLAEQADGRVPALYPIPREPEEIIESERTVLVELFTGAMCPPCAAADVAFDALPRHFDRGEVALIQWHLPVPAPEPMVSGVASRRAQSFGVRGTPTALFDGRERSAGGGKADAAPTKLTEYTKLVDKLLANEPRATIEVSAKLEGDRATLLADVRSEVEGSVWHAILVEDSLVFPGSNGILFHHHVARGAWTPDGGAPLTDGPTELQLSLKAVEMELEDAVFRVERQPFAIRPTRPDPEALAAVIFVTAPNGHVLQAETVRLGGPSRDG